MTLEQHCLLREMKQLMATVAKESGHSHDKVNTNAKPEAKRTAEPDATSAQPVRLTSQIVDFLASHYDFRYNLLTEETEFRPFGRRDVAFVPVGKRELNSFCLEAHMLGIPCWDKDLSRYIYSTRIVGYHPLRLYMEELPAWDDTDRLTILALRVSDTPLWVNGSHHWMLGLTAQWMGQTRMHVNIVAPILVSSEQGRQKSTFCKALMPRCVATLLYRQPETDLAGTI